MFDKNRPPDSNEPSGDVLLPGEPESKWFLRKKKILTAQEQNFADALFMAKLLKKTIVLYLGWRVRFHAIAARSGRSGTDLQHWSIAERHLRDARLKLSDWLIAERTKGVDVWRVLGEVYPAVVPSEPPTEQQEIERLARVFVGLEAAQKNDSFYLD